MVRDTLNCPPPSQNLLLFLIFLFRFDESLDENL